MSKCGFLIWVSLLAGVFGASAAGQQANKTRVGENESLKFDQQRIAAHMRELEDRMINLAGLLRDAKPDDSARLLMGVESAREHLILEQMQAISDMLAGINLSQATQEQEQVIDKLNRLKELLLNANLDLPIKLEQIERIAEVGARLRELGAKEEEQKSATESVLRQQRPTGPLAKNEERQQRIGQDIQQQANKIALAGKAAESIGVACVSMGKAASSLNQSQGTAATQSQHAAIERLRQAEQQLAELKQQLQQQAEAAARQRVSELLVEMIERQTKVQEATKQSVSRVVQQDPEIAAVLERLAGIEDLIIGAADECLELCELAEFSFVLPDALRDIRIRMHEARSELDQAHADDRLVQIEQQIIGDLTELLRAMKDAGKPGSPKVANAKGGCCNDRNKLVAEVKMLLWMQKTVARKTKDVRDRELAGNLLGEDLKQKSMEMKGQQDKIHEVTDRLRQLTNPGFVNGDSL